MDLYAIIEDHLARGQRGVLATIIRKLGAAPRGTGAKMFVSESGPTYGTIGGGRIEADIIGESSAVIARDKPKIVYYRMDSTAVEGEGMICGGNVDVLLEPVTERHKDVYRAMAGLEKQGSPGLVITMLSDHRFDKAVLEKGERIAGNPVPGRLQDRFDTYIKGKYPSVEGEIIVEPLLFSPPVYIFGAGHISLFLSRIAGMVDFSVTVVDDRADFAHPERFPEAERVLVAPFDKVFDALDFTGKEYVVIVTRGHAYDAVVLEEVMKRPARYVGMIGSRSKTRIIMDHLKAKGIDPDRLAAVHSPIGLAIGAETPEEIAVAIVGEMISVRREAEDAKRAMDLFGRTL